MTQTYILEALKRLKECIPSGTPTEHSGTGRRQHISRPFSALHPGSSVALSSSWRLLCPAGLANGLAALTKSGLDRRVAT